MVQRAFRSQYPQDSTPSHKAIKNIVSNFEKYGSVARVPPNKKILDQKREIAKNEVEKLVSDFPQLSIRKAASAVGVSATLVYHILHDDLHLKSYKFHQWHKLEEGDYNKRLNFTTWSLNLPNPALNP